MQYPDSEEIIALHHKYAPSEGVFNLVFTHCQIVATIAEQILASKAILVNAELVRAGALLHDIGAYKFIDAGGKFDKQNYICHGIEGYQMLKEEGLPEELCRIAERHTGVGITQQDIIKQKLSLPLRDYIAETMEEKLIMYADKFHSKTPQFNAYTTYREYVGQWGSDKIQRLEALAETFGIPDLEKIAQKYQQPII